jgi:hypothetical protein
MCWQDIDYMIKRFRRDFVLLSGSDCEKMLSLKQATAPNGSDFPGLKAIGGQKVKEVVLPHQF